MNALAVLIVSILAVLAGGASAVYAVIVDRKWARIERHWVEVRENDQRIVAANQARRAGHGARDPGDFYPIPDGDAQDQVRAAAEARCAPEDQSGQAGGTK